MELAIVLLEDLLHNSRQQLPLDSTVQMKYYYPSVFVPDSTAHCSVSSTLAVRSRVFLL